MKKFRFIALLIIMLAVSVPSRAQVFLMDEDAGGNIRIGESEFVVPVPYQGGDLDEYLPLGDGVMLLMGLGGAYLLRKRKKDKKKSDCF